MWSLVKNIGVTLRLVSSDVLKTSEEDEESEILKVLDASDSEEDDTAVGNDEHNEIVTNICNHKVGTVTHFSDDGNGAMIDDIYYFDLDKAPPDIKIGDRVSYIAYRKNENSSWIVKNVYSVCNEQWDKADRSCDEDAENGNNNEFHNAGVSERSIVGKVVKRVGRELFIQPGNYTCSLDKISTTFIPIKGDWVLLKSLVEIDNDSADKCGKLLTIESITPLRSYINKGKISHWESAFNQGIIDSKVQFTLDACDLGFVPVVGDQVLFKAVESEQGMLTWRALKITPLFEKGLSKNDKKDDRENREKCVSIEEIESDAKGKSLSEIMRAEEKNLHLLMNKTGINIMENCNFGDIDLDQEKEIVIIVKNESAKKQELLDASFNSARSLSQNQIKLISPKLKINGQSRQFFIHERSSVKFIFKITPRFVGKTSELFVWRFRNFEVGRFITVNVVDKYISDVLDSKLKKFSKKSNDLDSQKVLATKNGFIISAERKFRPAPFVPVKLGHFPVPNRLLEAVLDKNHENGRREDTLRRITNVMPCLEDPLNAYNYKQRFHALIYLEEIAAVTAIRNYDMPRAHFRKHLDYLILEVPGLAEKRPSLICGDTVIVSNPCATEEGQDLKYEGSIHKICKTEAWLKFNQSFHNSYNGADYTVVFNINRIGFRRCHQAVNVTHDHLSTDWLFPTSLKESKTQIIFDEDDDDDVVDNSNVLENNDQRLKNSVESVGNENLLDKIFPGIKNAEDKNLPGCTETTGCSDEVIKNFIKSVNAENNNSLSCNSSVNNADSVNKTKELDGLLLNNSSVCDNETTKVRSGSVTPRMSVAERLKIALQSRNNSSEVKSDVIEIDYNREIVGEKNNVSDNKKSNEGSCGTPKPSIDNFTSKNDSINLNKLFNVNNSFQKIDKSIVNNDGDDNKLQMTTLEEIENSLLSKTDNSEKLLNDISRSRNDVSLNSTEGIPKGTPLSFDNNSVKNVDSIKDFIGSIAKSSCNNLVNCDNSLKNENVVEDYEDCYSKVVTPSNDFKIKWQTTGRNWKFPTDQLKSKIRDVPKTYKRKLKWFNKKLNYYQKEAVKNILRGEARPLPYIIFGPPGTGKTITLVETALQLLQLIPESRLLICTPSNSAANLIAERMLDSGLDLSGILVRLCSYSYANDDNINISDRLRPFCTTANVKVIEDDLIGTVPDAIGGSSREVLGRHRVTIGTCITLGVLYNMGFPQGHFTHILIDEAGQATEPEILIPLAFLDEKFGQAILAGDPMQLGPVVQSRPAINCGFQQSLLSRFLQNFPYIRDVQSFPNTCGFDPRIITRLVDNYRSLPEILKLPSTMFYESSLVPQVNEIDSKEVKLLMKLKDELPSRDDISDGVLKRLPPALIFHGVRGCNFQEEDSPSWFNPQEIVQVIFYVNIFYKAGLNADQIGVVTPYQKQVMKIRSCLNKLDIPLPKIGSVEEFQGQERMAIILSAVRSNSKFVVHDAKHALGFISSPQRLNVALTRARAVLVVIGNPHLLNCDPYWRTVLKYCIDNKAYCGCDLPSELES